MIRCWLRGAFLGALVAGAPLPALAATVADFAGVWRGVEVEVVEGDDPFELAPEDLNVTVARDRDGFRISWNAPDKQRIEAVFAPTDRPGVFFVRPSGNPLLDLFRSPATGNPLLGETLLWSRLEGDTLVVYRLMLERDGGFDLHRYAWTLESAETLALDFSRLSEGPTRVAFVGRLQRAGS
jgi:hypothetical protein